MCGAAGQGVHTRGDASYDCNRTPNTQPTHPSSALLNCKVLQVVCDRSLGTHLDCSICAEQTVENRKRNILTSLSSWGVPLSYSWPALIDILSRLWFVIDKVLNKFCETFPIWDWPDFGIEPVDKQVESNPSIPDLGWKRQFSSTHPLWGSSTFHILCIFWEASEDNGGTSGGEG